MFLIENKEVDMGGLSWTDEIKCCDDSPDGSWTCTRPDGHDGVHRGGWRPPRKNFSHWGAEWDDDRSTDDLDEFLQDLEM